MESSLTDFQKKVRNGTATLEDFRLSIQKDIQKAKKLEEKLNKEVRSKSLETAKEINQDILEHVKALELKYKKEFLETNINRTDRKFKAQTYEIDTAGQDLFDVINRPTNQSNSMSSQSLD